MKFFFWSSLLFFCLLLQRGLAESVLRGIHGHARTPPRGWNSYDSFSWIINEEQFLQNAEILSQKLLKHGYEYAVVDFLWYRKKVQGAWMNSLGFDVIDEWGRMVPDPIRWPSSVGGKGLSEVAKKVHRMGLKFGIHVMRGISTQAYNANTPILDIIKGRAYEESGRQWRAQDIGLKNRSCPWMDQGFMSVNTNLNAGRAFLRSLYEQYAEWGVDFVKHDCVFGEDLDIAEITTVSNVLKKLNRPIVYSLSPGVKATPAMAKEVSGLVNMYRITGDDWDSWKDVASHFNISRDFAASKLIGAKGLRGKSWPDLDMLPLGWLTDPGSNEGPHRRSNLNLDEQKTQVTLWAMAKSPLMYGGDLRSLDDTTYGLITHPTILEIDSFSSNNTEFPYITVAKDSSSNKILNWESNSLNYGGVSNKHVLALGSCKDKKAKGWVIDSLDPNLKRICWKDNEGSKFKAPFCLEKRNTLLTSDEEIMYNNKYEGKLHLFGANTMELCLNTSSNEDLILQKLRSSSLSPCRWDANQMLELNLKGSIVNTNNSGLCATVESLEDDANSGGIRSWIATGRRGQIYLSFFNLSLEKLVISAKISDLAKALPGRNLNQASYKCTEAWSGQDCGIVKETISMAVEMHGTALFVLNFH